MNQPERRLYLINALLREQPQCRRIMIPQGQDEQEQLLRSLLNVRLPAPISPDVEQVQDDYLRQRNRERGIVHLSELSPIRPELYLWRGDITRLAVGAIVNAANTGMTGCYHPCHACIDNCIHTYAGMQLRLACDAIMRQQGHDEPTGQAKLTPAFNLPCDYVLHTVGPIVQGALTSAHEQQLASCYRSCLKLAEAHGIESIAFCCISTGVFMFPNRRAAEIAVKTVQDYKQETGSPMKIIFNVFKEADELIYADLLTSW